MPSTPTSSRALRKSLRLPRSFPRVAHWLFDEPHLPFHSNAPLLTAHDFTASVAIQIRDQWQNFGNVFDPFQLERILTDDIGQFDDAELDGTVATPGSSLDGQAFTSMCVCDLDVVFTPVTFVSSNIVVGYTFCTGSSFDREMVSAPRGTFRGRTHMYGRFAYDMDNDHMISTFHGVTPALTGIVDITSNGLSRTRCFYAVPNLIYSSERLPSSPLSMVSITELRSRYENLFAKCGFDMNSDKSFDVSESLPDVRLRDGDIFDNGGLSRALNRYSVHDDVTVSDNYMKDLMEITSKLNNLTFVLEGTYTGPTVCRIIVRNSTTAGFRQMGSVFTEHISLTRSARRECVSHVWQLYTSEAFGMRSERRGGSLMVASSNTAKSYSRGTSKRQLEETSKKLDSSHSDVKNELKSDRKGMVKKKSPEKTGGVQKASIRKRNPVPWVENNLDRMKLSFLTDTVAPGC